MFLNISFSGAEITTKMPPQSTKTSLRLTTKSVTVSLTTNHIDALHSEHDQLVDNKTAAENRLTTAQNNLTAAQELSARLGSVQTKVSALVSSRIYFRAEYSDSTIAAESCSEIIEFINKISVAVNNAEKEVANRYAKRITDSSVTCTTAEKLSLQEKQSTLTAAKSSADDFVIKYTKTIKEVKTEINDLITKLNVINSALGGYGETTLHHGTHHDHEEEDGHTSSINVQKSTASISTPKYTFATTTSFSQTTTSFGEKL